MTEMTTGDAIAKSLIAHDVDTIFGIPGAHMYDFNDALARHSRALRFITTRHEQGAGYMAFGYAKSTGRTGVYTVVPGPGMLNSAAALCTAYGANTPVLCVTGNIMTHLIGQGRGQLHELPDQLQTMRGFTGYAERINHPNEAPQIVAESFRAMHKGRVRPAAIEAPWDVFGMRSDVEIKVDRSIPKPPKPSKTAIAQAAELIAKAKNPLIVVGAGAYGAASEVLALAKKIQAPVTAHRSGKGVVSNESPYGLLSVAAWEYWPKCDLVIGIGSRLELLHFRWRWRAQDVPTIRIDIDPTEMVRLKPEVGIITDAKIGTKTLLAALAKMPVRKNREGEFETYSKTAIEKISKVQPQIDYLSAIREVLPKTGFFVEEISQVGFTARFAFPVYKPRQYVTCGYQDNLGFGFHTALGVKVGNPDKAVVSVSGDGGFMFGVQELATAVQFQINVVCIIFNNSAFGNVRRDQSDNYDGRLLGADLVNPDFIKLAESFGAVGIKVDSPEELKSALKKGFKEIGPVIIEVQLPRGGQTSPWEFIHPAPPVSF
jgi:acetolactate synthase I/II/III large subunit